MEKTKQENGDSAQLDEKGTPSDTTTPSPENKKSAGVIPDEKNEDAAGTKEKVQSSGTAEKKAEQSPRTLDKTGAKPTESADAKKSDMAPETVRSLSDAKPGSEPKEKRDEKPNETPATVNDDAVKNEGSPDPSKRKQGGIELKRSSVSPEREAYQKLRQSLKSLVHKKVKLDAELEKIEEDLKEKEDIYLQEASAGNVAKGFDQYTKSSQNRRKSVISDDDRIFTQSSTTFDAEL